MNQRNFRTNGNEGSGMFDAEHNNYRRAFWIAVIAIVVLAVVASVLWWRLSHAGTPSQPGKVSKSSQPMEAIPSSGNTSGSESTSLGNTQAGNLQEVPLAPIQLTP